MDWVRDNIVADPNAKQAASASTPSPDIDKQKKAVEKQQQEVEKKKNELEQKEKRIVEKERALQERETQLQAREESLWSVRLRQEAVGPPPSYDHVYTVPIQGQVVPVAPYQAVTANIHETLASATDTEKRY